MNFKEDDYFGSIIIAFIIVLFVWFGYMGFSIYNDSNTYITIDEGMVKSVRFETQVTGKSCDGIFLLFFGGGSCRDIKTTNTIIKFDNKSEITLNGYYPVGINQPYILKQNKYGKFEFENLR